ncbi:ATP-dependent protease La [Coprinopsis cinerea okayama7|uniref:Lon protease homolog n=1 Tax=Coprinopsis cinerea (strain Okayama-7 / 130 / ATCC MYA-4618 / FGSC 9003) TaxID=240176 RepID=A8NIR1_COPC7|nr:ATP-dependent protease La [Coprinopsis cinerea okayama7\|eukprot:XP_001834051.2 ATP-dependent protease La [Coprinopsis cinerea okayama7\
MATSRLPVLALPHPLILLPSARVTVPVSKTIGEQLLALIEESDALPIVATVPITSPTASQRPAGDLDRETGLLLPPPNVDTRDGNQKSTKEEPNEELPLSEWGTAARVLRLIRPPASTRTTPRQPYLVSLHGLTRIKLINRSKPKNKLTLSILNTSLPNRDVEYAPQDTVPSREAVERFKQSASRLLERLSRDSMQMSRREGYSKVLGMLEDIQDARTPWMADVMISTVGCDYADKLAILSSADSDARLQTATNIFLKQASISEVSRKIASAVDESLSKQQKEFFLRQQLAAIQRELQALQRSNSGTNSNPAEAGSTSELDDDEQHEADDLADLKRRIEAMAPGSEERKMGVREWRRLKRIPQGSVENGVIRTYLEWLTSIPWPNSTTLPSTSATTSTSVTTLDLKDRGFLDNARAQLDADHFGLEKIKKRLIEYLAVVRLKEMNAEKERLLEEKAAAAKADSTEGKEVVLYDKAKAQEQQRAVQTPSPAPLIQPPRPRKGVRGPILLFVGPPGTGKTSLGQSIAKSLGRPFQRISLGGVRDEAEIRGHRRTYVASGPGLIVQALRKAGRPDPVLLLDEIDKIGQSNFHGDPGAALLEVLDPEQNWSFNDHYINVPIDLSQVLFICTANSLETISAPLLDRCEVIQLSGYTYDEKLHIARRFLLPKQLTANGLEKEHVNITEPAMLEIATRYTREAGVRSLERAIGGVVRFKAVEWAEFLDKGGDPNTLTQPDPPMDASPPTYRRAVLVSDLEKILGIARYDESESERELRRGIVYGLVVTGAGEGGIMPVETIAVPGSGKLKLTGSLGDVIKESGDLALSWVKRYAWELGLVDSPMEDVLKSGRILGLGSKETAIDVHLHLPAGAQKKDGPSAGIAMVCAMVSLLTGACVPTNIAMTGEITLRGRVTAVGGIKEKVLGAHRAQMTKVILPYANRKDVEHDVALEIRNEMEFVFVKTLREALEAAFGEGALGWRRNATGGHLLMESRL